MHKHHLFHSFKEELDLPSCTVELDNVFIGPRTLREVCDQQRPAHQEKRVRLELLPLFLCFLFSLLTRFSSFFWWKCRSNDSHVILFSFIDAPCIPRVDAAFHVFEPCNDIKWLTISIQQRTGTRNKA